MTPWDIEGRELVNRSGNVVMDLEKIYARFARNHLSNEGVVRHRATA